MSATLIKANGIHYTPPELAAFLAGVTAEHTSAVPRRVLDPACGDGELLSAFALAIPEALRRNLEVVGYDTNPIAVREARRNLALLKVGKVTIKQQDFLEVATPSPRQGNFLESTNNSESDFDVVISNPPYVRTQVLGSAKAQFLAKRYSLTGRVDLYHAFAIAMASVLRPSGTLGLLTSNRFLTIKSGHSLRKMLCEHFGLQAIYDLGDTKLFSAAVLPVIVIGKKSEQGSECRFDRVYEYRKAVPAAQEVPSVLEAVRDREISGLVRSPAGVFSIERGILANDGIEGIWSLATADNQDWTSVVKKHTCHTFADVAKIRVGIKTTADEVFIRKDWSGLPNEERPESHLVFPLIRHFDAARWLWNGQHQHSVLYPHITANGKRQPVDLRSFPGAGRYLESHRKRLTSRRYVIEGGRQWYEIWVPHNPEEWAKPKIVFPDISEEPRFFLDSTGAIVNGDCYWMTLRPGFGMEHLLLMLAVANSSFITRYYDIKFHNKLYAGRRRFMAQFVKHFPLPDAKSKCARRAIQCVSQLVKSSESARNLEAEIDGLVWQSFGLVKETTG